MKINPCPHCGAQPAKAYVVVTRYIPAEFVVQCNLCGMNGPIMEEKQAAVDAWNSLYKKENP